jgi:hypothetical protein
MYVGFHANISRLSYRNRTNTSSYLGDSGTGDRHLGCVRETKAHPLGFFSQTYHGRRRRFQGEDREVVFRDHDDIFREHLLCGEVAW